MNYSAFLYIIAVSLFLCAGCNKGEMPYRRSAEPLPGVSLMPPSADAGQDLLVELPVTETVLNGTAFDWNFAIKESYWTKISGPGSFKIENRTSLQTRLANLERGVYQFELSVISTPDLVDKDTMSVTVGQLPTNPREILLSGQEWQCLAFNCYFLIENIYAHIPVGSFFKIFIKKDGNAAWEEVKHESNSLNNSSHSFNLSEGKVTMRSVGHLLNDRSEIKILYD